VRSTLARSARRSWRERLFRDSPPLHRGDPRGLAEQAPRWITTEKDAVKLVPAWAAARAIEVLAIELAVDEPEALLDWLEARCVAAERAPRSAR
jgi:tetraacyldisaccharide-1-P 4'-kinase